MSIEGRHVFCFRNTAIEIDIHSFIHSFNQCELFTEAISFPLPNW